MQPYESALSLAMSFPKQGLWPNLIGHRQKADPILRTVRDKSTAILNLLLLYLQYAAGSRYDERCSWLVRVKRSLIS